MRLRERPEDPSLPWRVSSVTESRDGEERILASLSGSSWDVLPEEARHRLLTRLLTPPRSGPIGMRLAGWHQWELESFIARPRSCWWDA